MSQELRTNPPRSPTFPAESPPPASGAARWLYRHVPAFDSLRTYSFPAFGADLMAGLTVATVAVPQAMAYATLAGLPPQYGLYTAVIMTAVGALLDSSKQLINGPTNAISIALLSALAVIPEADKASAAVLFALFVGLVQLGITLLRLGDLTRYVSHAVIVGFTLGAGIMLVLDQLKNLIGLPALGEAHDHFLKRFWLTMTSGQPWHAATVTIGAGTILLVVAVRKLNGWLKRHGARFPIPQHLVAVAVMAALVWGFGLERQGVQIVGYIPPSLPRFEAPSAPWEHVRVLTGNAFGVAILGLLEAIAMAKAIAAQTGQRLDINQQCLSEGMANLAGSFFHCMPGSGSLTRSAVNQQAGAVTQWSGVFSAIAVAVTIVLFAPFAQYIPRASLAGLLMLAAFRMVDYRQLLFHLRATRFDALIVLATALAAIFISVEFCIVIGVFLSFALYVPRAAQVQLTEAVLTGDGQSRERLPGDLRCGRMLLYNLEGELSFGAAPELDAHLTEIEKHIVPDTRLVLLYLRRARNPDATFLGLLRDFHARLQKRKVELILCGVRPDLAKGLRNTKLDAVIGWPHIIPETDQPGDSAQHASDRAYAILGPDVCPVCPRRKDKPEPLHFTI
ncbi:MAG TPA: SulP family inorganic anion transporter [Gemmataceae bacterium]|nr:SulP family inorganic anion transporter [Gemmataceae bacterium]